jgi:predicted metal-dependent peptidase
VPGNVLEELEKVLEKKSKIRWQKELDVVLKKCCGRIEAGGTDFSMARPSKRSYARQQLRPGLVAYQPEVCFIEDTSGSMGKQQIIECTIQMVGILKSLGIESAWFIQADTTVAAPPRKIRTRDLLKTMKIHGRGGTDFDEALKAAERLKPKPDVIVYLTDGDGGATYKPRGIEVVWCIVPAHYNRKPDASFGHVILITPEGTKKVE